MYITKNILNNIINSLKKLNSMTTPLSYKIKNLTHVKYAVAKILM